MNPYSKHVNTYQKSNIENLNPGEQVAQLLLVAVRHVNTAKEKIISREYEERLKASDTAIAILEGLASVLTPQDSEQEKVAKNLRTFYTSTINLIAQINITNDTNLCDIVIDSLGKMAQYWRKGQEALAKSFDSQTSKNSSEKPGPLNFSI